MPAGRAAAWCTKLAHAVRGIERGLDMQPCTLAVCLLRIYSTQDVLIIAIHCDN